MTIIYLKKLKVLLDVITYGLKNTKVVLAMSYSIAVTAVSKTVMAVVAVIVFLAMLVNTA